MDLKELGVLQGEIDMLEEEEEEWRALAGGGTGRGEEFCL